MSIALSPSGTPLAELATVLVPIDLSFNTDPLHADLGAAGLPGRDRYPGGYGLAFKRGPGASATKLPKRAENCRNMTCSSVPSSASMECHVA